MSGQTHSADAPGSRPTRGVNKGGSHSAPRHRYVCYSRRTGGTCTAPSVRQDEIEAELLAVLRNLAPPTGLLAEVESRTRGRVTTERRPSPKRIEAELERIGKLYQWGEQSEGEYLTERPPWLSVGLSGSRVRPLPVRWRRG
jgi:hypothetical protein